MAWRYFREQATFTGTSHLSSTAAASVDAIAFAKLAVTRTLGGHQGCVNTLSWNTDGTVLASGSDDLRVILWNFPEAEVRTTVQTKHTNNIFGARLLPGRNDSILATCSADKTVQVHHVRPDGTSETAHVHKSHTGRVKRLISETPFTFTSVGEDGEIREFDERVAEGSTLLLQFMPGLSGQCLRCNFRNSTSSMKTAAISPLNQHLLCVGAEDPFVRLYDRRMLGSDPQKAVCSTVAVFKPTQDLKRWPIGGFACTGISFSTSRPEIVVNYSGDHVCVYDVNSSIPYTTFCDVAVDSSNPKHDSAHHDTGKRQNDIGCSNTQIEKLLEHKELGEIQFRRGNYQRSVWHFNTGLSCVPRSSRHLLEEIADVEVNIARALLKRNWTGDSYAGLTGVDWVLALYPEHVQAHIAQIECLYEVGSRYMVSLLTAIRLPAIYACTRALFHLGCRGVQLKRYDEAKDALKAAESYLPSTLSVSELKEKVMNADASSESSNSDSDSDSESDSDSDTVNSERASEATQTPDNTVAKRAYHEGDSEPQETSTSSASTASLAKITKALWESKLIGTQERYVGAGNYYTDIKEAVFLGDGDSFIGAGSDDGHLYVWDRRTQNVIKMVKADESIVNCVAPNPRDHSTIVVSGIDSTIKVVSPHASHIHLSQDEMEELMDQNQVRLSRLQRRGIGDITYVFDGDSQEHECVIS